MGETNQSNIMVQVEKKSVLLVTEYKLVMTAQLNIDDNKEGFEKGYEMAEALESQVSEIILVMSDGTLVKQQLQELEMNEEKLSLIDEDEKIVYPYEVEEGEDE